jgi:alpha-tubulin suppressor-like RCC1 family protein
MPTKDFVMAACSRKHTFFVTVTGGLLAAGTSTAGELGIFPDQSQYEIDSPMQVHGIGRVSDVATGDEHTLAINYDTHELYGWGNQLNGRLGLGSNSQASVNTARHIQILRDGAKTKFVGVACGKDFSIAVDSEGALWFAGVKRHEVSTSPSNMYLEGMPC